MLKTILNDWHRDADARLVDFAGWEMPIQYTSIVDEHHAVRRQAGLFDISHMGRLWFHGTDATKFLDRILTNDVAGLKIGQVRYSLICRQDGGILDDVLIYRFEDRYLLVVNGANREKIVDWIAQEKGDDEFDMHDETLSSMMLAIQGPRATDILSPNVGIELAELKYYRASETVAFGKTVILSRTGYTGEDGFELIAPIEYGVEIWDACLSSAAEMGIKLIPCGLGCRDTLRLEAAMPLYGHEMDETVDPLTAGLRFGVRFKEEKFIGQDALEALSDNGDIQTRVGLELAGRRIAREGAMLFQQDRQIGQVTSGSFSPTLEKPIAMGYVDPQFAAPGTQVEVEIRNKREPATVVALPFYRRPASSK